MQVNHSIAKSLSLLLALGVAAMAQPVITPSSPPVVAQGTTLKFTANVRVQWSLGPGSAGTIDADGTYHAPAHVDVNQKAGGCQALPDDHIYNTRIDTLPVLSTSAAWIAAIPTTGLSFPASWGLNIMDSSTPSQPMHFYYTPQTDGLYQVPAWPNLKQQSGVFYDPLTAGDRHIVAVNHDTCQFDEFYNAYPLGTNVACPTCTGQGGVKFQGNSYALNGGTDAAGMYLEPLTPRLEEFYAGAIKHALRFTLKNNYLSPAFVWPARANANPWGQIPYGSRFRLRNSYNIATFSPRARIVLTALQQYGMFVADGGFNFDVEVGTDVTLDAGVMAAFAEIQNSALRSTDFEIVDESALMVNSASGQVNDQNPYVTPAGFATVIATNPTNTAHPARVRVTLEGIVVDAPEPAVWIQSGVSKQLTAWVSGTTNTALQWSMNPVLGALTVDGQYTAPAVSVPTTTWVTAASAADPGATTTLLLTVLPAGPIRIDVGNSADYGPDSHGNMWWRDQASESSWGVSHNNWYLGQNPWPQTVPDIALYYTDRYSLGDMVYQFSVPNGNYRITAMMAVPGNGTFPAGAYVGHLETQGQIVYHDFDLASLTGGQQSQPGTVDLPAQVTDGTLYFAVRRVTTPTTTPYPLLLNGLEITADNGAPSLTVYSPDTSALATGQTRQFYAVGRYMPNSVTWSVSPAIGSIDANGRYTAPSTPQLSDQQVTVTAVSTVDSSKTATATLTLTYGTITVAPSQATINRSATQQFTASLGGIADANVRWSIAPQVGAIDANGLYTAPDVLATDTAITVTATSTDTSGKTATAVVTVRANAPAIRIDCGNTVSPITDSSGNVWDVDHGWTNLSSSAPSSHLGECCAVFSNVAPADQPIYQSATYTDPYASPLADFYYSFPLPNGLYRVTLKLGSYNAHGTIGQYVMNVVANGTTVLSNYDVVKAAGGNLIAVDQSFDVSVTGKVLRLDFLHVGKGLAQVNAIQIVAEASSGSGMSQRFAATYSPGGASVSLAYFMVNSAVISPMSCFVEYNVGANSYRLLDDAGITWSASVPVGSGTASNSQCTISGAGGGATSSGDSLTVNFPITFNPAYAGAQNVFQLAVYSSGKTSAWQQLGTWTVPGTGGTLPPGAIRSCNQNGAPCVASLTASNQNGLNGTFTGIFTHPGGAGQHYLGYMLFLPTPNIVWYTATGSCLVEYNRISNAMRLINDAGTGWLPGTLGIPLSQGGTLSNSHCSVDVTHSSAKINGEIMTVTAKVTFASGFTGELATFMQAFDMSGAYTSMTQFGNWMASPAVGRRPGPYVVGVNPTSGTGSSTTLSFTAGHTSGVPALWFVTMLISPVIAGGVPCQAFYFQASNTLNLVNDDGTAMVSTTGIVPGTVGTLSNSRCTINTVGATRVISGNNVTVSVPMAFNPGTFAGTKNLYVNAFDNGGLLSHWVTGGTWTVP